MAGRKKILICRVGADDRVLEELKDVLEAAGVEVRDDVVPTTLTNDSEREDEKVQCDILAPQVDWADALIVLITATSDESWCVNWQIEYAAKHGKRVVGVFGDGSSDADMPSSLDVYGDARVPGSRIPWIIDIINGDVHPEDSWEDPDTGKPREPEWPIERKC